MQEITITGINSITYPRLEVWDWLIAMYLFLGGMAAGLMVLSAVSQFRAKGAELPKSSYIGPIMAPFILAIAMVFVFFDLSKKLSAFWFYLSFNVTSPMSWVGWTVGVSIVMSALWALASLPDKTGAKLKLTILNKLSTIRKPLAGINLTLGVMVGIGTGVLLSSFVARPLWNSPVLPILFLVSGISTGAALLILIEKDTEESLFFKKTDIALIAAEIVLIALFFYGHFTSTASHVEAIMPFFKGGYYFPFWIATLILAIALPLAIILEAAEVAGRVRLRIHLSAWLVLAAGLILRLSIVYAGQLSSIKPLAGF